MKWVLLFSAIFLLGFFFFLYVKAYVRKHTSPDAILSTLKEEVRRLEADIDEKTEQDLQLLEERIKTLRDLIAEAERRIAVFNKELSRSRAEENAYAALKPEPHSPKAAQKKAPKRKTPPRKAPGELKPAYDSVHPRSLLETLEVREPDPEPRFIRSSNPISPKPRPLKERVEELRQAGFSADIIADRLGLTITETKIYLALDGEKTPR